MLMIHPITVLEQPLNRNQVILLSHHPFLFTKSYLIKILNAKELIYRVNYLLSFLSFG